MSANVEEDFLKLFRYFYKDPKNKKFEEFEKNFQEAIGKNVSVTF